MTRSVTSMTIDDVDHYSAEEKAQIIASYPRHEREARAKGIPTLGSGRIFPIEVCQGSTLFLHGQCSLVLTIV